MAAGIDTNMVQDLLTGAASNGLWTLLAYLGGKAIAAIPTQASANAQANLFPAAAANVSAEFARTDADRSKLDGFLTSPEVESIVRQVYATALLNGGKPRIPDIREEFVRAFAKYLDVAGERVDQVAADLFNPLLSECERLLQNAIDANLLSAHETRSISRHTRLLGEIENISRALDLLRSASHPDVGTVLNFEERYRTQVVQRHQFIQPPQLETGKKFPIDELYVIPTFLRVSADKQQEAQAISIPEFLASTHRTVLLGNPGGGKSTLALKLCHDLASRYDERLLNNRLLTPILVVLREYGAQKKAEPCSIMQFIEGQSSHRYQVAPPSGAFEYLLLNGRAMVIFDGLDELLDTSYRQEISADVESFCSLYPSVPALVTSREIGYKQAPLDSKQFTLLRIAPFDGHQVADYATKWFSIDDELDRGECARKTKAFMTESALATDLRSNPLMLGLMCNLYRAEGYIPRNRPEIYEKCSLMLFERWDKARGILVPLPFEEHIKPAMRHLAYWIYSEESRQGGVTESRLIDETAAYLEKRVFEDPQKARRAAADFITFCTGRAWVFTDTGTTSEGERLFQFTHRTFLEYFGATYLFSVHPTPGDLVRVLLPHIAKQEWDVVAQLAFQVQSRSIEGASDKLLSALLENAIQLSRQERWNVLLFAARTLESIVPSPALRRAVASACMRELIALDQPGRERSRHGDGAATLVAMQSAGAENGFSVVETIERVLTETVQSESAPKFEQVMAYDIAARSSMIAARRDHLRNRGWADWSGIWEKVHHSCPACLERVAAKDLQAALIAHERAGYPLNKLLQWHGASVLFYVKHSVVFGVWWTPIGVQLLIEVCADSGPRDPADTERDLSAIGRFLVAAEPPWAKAHSGPRELDLATFCDDITVMFERRKVELGGIGRHLTVEAAFGVFALAAVVLECIGEEPRKALLAELGEDASVDLKGIGTVLAARFDRGGARDRLQTSFGGAYAALVQSWVEGTVSFVSANPAAVDLAEDVGSPQIALELDESGLEA